MPAFFPMQPGDQERLDALEAYDQAFQATPQPFGARWSTLGRVLTNSVARFAYVIPIAGYFVLYSDYFQTLFTFSSLGPVRGFLTFTQRIHLTYYGAITLFFAYCSYVAFSPRLLRNKNSAHQFVSDILSSHDYLTVQHVLRSLIDYLQSIRIEKLDEPRQGKLRAFLVQLKERQDNINFAYDSGNVIPNALRCFYQWQDEVRQYPRLFTLLITALGFIALTLPALDLFVRVLQASGLSPTWLTKVMIH